MSVLGSRVGRIDVTIDDTVEGHCKASSTDGGQEDPQQVNARGNVKLFDGDEVTNQDKWKRKQRVLNFDER